MIPPWYPSSPAYVTIFICWASSLAIGEFFIFLLILTSRLHPVLLCYSMITAKKENAVSSHLFSKISSGLQACYFGIFCLSGVSVFCTCFVIPCSFAKIYFTDSSAIFTFPLTDTQRDISTFCYSMMIPTIYLMIEYHSCNFPLLMRWLYHHIFLFNMILIIIW